MELSNIINKFLNNEINASEIENMLKSNQIVFSPKTSIEYGQLTRPLNQKYYEIMGEGINFDVSKSYPPRVDCFICLLKAIENKRKVEDYYSEYFKNLNSNEDNISILLEDDNNLEIYKKNENDVIWWIDNPEVKGEHLFTFDKKKIFNLFRDYPYQLTPEEKEIFDKENPYWADFFKDRK